MEHASTMRYLDMLEEIRTAADKYSLSKGPDTTNRFVLVTVGTFAYKNYVRNLACSLERFNSSFSGKLVLFSLDSHLHSATMPSNVHSIQFNHGAASKSATRYGTKSFDKLSRQKLAVVNAVLATGYDALFIDADIVWCNPAFGVYDIARQARDTRANIIAHSAQLGSQAINTGMYYAAANPTTRRFLTVAENLNMQGNDQEAANKVACNAKFGGKRLSDGHCVWADQRKNKAEIRVLTPYEKYPIGCTKHNGRQFNRENPRKIGELCDDKTIPMFHFSCFRDNLKQLRMRQAGLWLVNKRNPSVCKY